MDSKGRNLIKQHIRRFINHNYLFIGRFLFVVLLHIMMSGNIMIRVDKSENF